MPDVYFVSRVAPFVAPKKEVKMSIQKINTKQLTQIKSVIKNGKKQFYFWYYCPDLKKIDYENLQTLKQTRKYCADKQKKNRC